MSMPPSGAGPGDRGFQLLITKAMEFYLRHKTEIDNTLDSLIIEAIMVIVGAVAPGGDIAELNDPGPE